MSHTTPYWQCRSPGGTVHVFAGTRELARTAGAKILGRGEDVVTVRYVSNRGRPAAGEWRCGERRLTVHSQR